MILMPKSTALWLKMNTKLSIKQIADFCELDVLLVESLHIGNASYCNPIETEQLTWNEIHRCEVNKEAKLKSSFKVSMYAKMHKKNSLSIHQKTMRPQVISWIMSKYPTASAQKIAKLLASTTPYVTKILADLPSEKIDPVAISICKYEDLKMLEE